MLRTCPAISTPARYDVPSFVSQTSADRVPLVAEDGLILPRRPVELVDLARVGGRVAVLHQAKAWDRWPKSAPASRDRRGRRRSGAPRLARAIARHHRVREMRRLAPAQGILGVHPGRKLGDPQRIAG